MKVVKNVAIKTSKQLEKMAITIACDSKSMLMWGEVPMPSCLRAKLEDIQQRTEERG